MDGKSIGIELIDSDENDIIDNNIKISGKDSVAISLKRSFGNKIQGNNIVVDQEIDNIIKIINEKSDESINPQTGNSYKSDILHILREIKSGQRRPSWLDRIESITSIITGIISIPSGMQSIFELLSK